MKNIAFFLRNIDPDKLPFSSRELYYYSYQQNLLAMKRAGANAAFVTNNATYLGKGRFREAFTIDHVGDVSELIPLGEFQADVVYDKGGFAGQDTTMVTDWRLEPLMNDKTEIYRRFPEFQPKSVICETPEEVAEAMKAMPGDMVVVKGAEGTGGKRVYIGHKGEVNVPADETYPLIVQEFIDMSEGIPGLVKGPHDLRILMTGSAIAGATVRQPAEGSYHSNVSRGGSEMVLDVDAIPEDVADMAAAIDAKLPDHPRYYAIDFARGKHGWRLIELNRKPGLFQESDGVAARHIMDRLAAYLVSLA